MSELLGVPVKGTVAPDTFEPILPAEEIDQSLVEEWRAYLTNCLKHNFAVHATLSVTNSGGTVLWLPTDEHSEPSRLQLLQEFAKDCLQSFLRSISGRRPSLSAG